MKILLLIDSFGSGGAQRQMVTLSILLKQNGYDVSFLTYSNDNFFQKNVKDNYIDIYHIDNKNYLSRIFKVRRFIRKQKFDVVISFMDVPNFLNNLATIGGKKWRVITSERSSKEAVLTSLKGRIFSFFQRYSDFIVCNSYNAREMWLKYKPQFNNKLKVIYNPVILPVISSNYIPKRNGKLYIVIAASYQYLKNPIGVIKALVLMDDDERNKIKINWYGRKDVSKGDMKAYNEAFGLIKKNNLEDVITLNEPTKDIAIKMHEADFVGLFSELEGLPNAICEGMKLGKPIIMTKVSDYAQLVDDNNGFLCEWDNPESIKNAFVTAMNLKDDEIIQMGKNSKEKSKLLFSKEIIVEQWINIISR
ncbi:MAG: glycosyltransferase [Bacteroides sp.]|nr:glycosyltransferase [Bacteroides sp.]